VIKTIKTEKETHTDELFTIRSIICIQKIDVFLFHINFNAINKAKMKIYDDLINILLLHRYRSFPFFSL